MGYYSTVVNEAKRKELNQHMRKLRINFFVRYKLGIFDKVIREAISANWTYPDAIDKWLKLDQEQLEVYHQLIQYLVHRRYFQDPPDLKKMRWLWSRFRDTKRYELYRAYGVRESVWVDE